MAVTEITDTPSGEFWNTIISVKYVTYMVGWVPLAQWLSMRAGQMREDGH